MPRKKTTEEFVAEARRVHGETYDYSRAVYRGTGVKVCVICSKHGEFLVEPGNHIFNKSGCPKCKAEKARERYLMRKEDFVKKAQSVHHGKYDYSLVDYQGTDTDVSIICHATGPDGKEHGIFRQRPHNHLHGAGCPKCAGKYVQTTEEYVESLKAKYGDKYDYSKVVYKGHSNKVCIICPKHGEFWINPQNFLRQNGCPKCSGNYGLDKESFIELASSRFNGKYDYSRVEWNGYRRKVTIICPEHGEFEQSPLSHLRTAGCSKCSGKYLDREYFIDKARVIHGDRYDYSKVDFVDSKEPVCIICPKHGEFWQTPNSHLLGHGCRDCYNESTSARLTKSAANFISLANEIHHNKYDYSLMQYVNRSSPVSIVCPKHGPFVQVPKNHLHGSGCPMCNSSVLEDTVTNLLKRQNIAFVPEKTFEWLEDKGTMRLDFYLPDYNIAIECQGVQHFQAVDFWGGEESLSTTRGRDAVKKRLCEEHGIKVLYFSNLGIRYPYKVIEDPGILLKTIQLIGTADSPLWLPDPELPLEFEEPDV